uniref:Uncharacterized protein n=1 Tax=Strix occidentalis caurina TaxID=311401 RepID=A0A8D0EID1_STROC
MTDPNENGSENFHIFTRVFLPCMYLAVFILGLAGNALVFVILVFYEKLKIHFNLHARFHVCLGFFVGFSFWEKVFTDTPLVFT